MDQERASRVYYLKQIDPEFTWRDYFEFLHENRYNKEIVVEFSQSEGKECAEIFNRWFETTPE